ncbi:Retrovirus-related Pol polyprotein from type-2 retrotransposable element R2DM [Symbiodinium microadriaticum]|uniref:Retrovirus-related Pol polyprotein from type-2 retrotransposable element R2DM n=1 Tax=Symbiodinium microadriaticum TaxID=2951 RepID=A0A1Q9DZR3_SYMMI|nr:Retrovirus-related Pol polyprotein from type-2 retrotransposable element R2DM [Symbiodinium microadriaticum]
MSYHNFETLAQENKQDETRRSYWWSSLIAQLLQMLIWFYLRVRYYDLLEVYDGQVLGLCMDGWARDEDLATGQYGVAPSFDWVPVKVYECPAGSSKDECAPVANMTAFHRSRTYKTGVYCWQAWNCSSQPCDAYEKAGMRDSPFEYPELAHDQFTNLSGWVVGYTGTFIFVCWQLVEAIWKRFRGRLQLKESPAQKDILRFTWLIAAEALIFVFLFPGRQGFCEEDWSHGENIPMFWSETKRPALYEAILDNYPWSEDLAHLLESHFPAEAKPSTILKVPLDDLGRRLKWIYSTGQVIPPLGAWDGPIELFTMEELEQAISKGKRGKAVGVDGTSQEFLVGLAAVPGGKEALLRFFNKVYQEASIPADWNTALMVVIPKELFPVDPKSLRPLAMSSSVAKCYCRLLLGRTSGYLRHTGPSQCSGEGRQTAEYVFTVARVMELEAEWRRGVVMAKIDLHKAYDMVDRPALLGRLRQAMGDGPTFRSWHALLAETDAVLQTGWDCSRLQLDRGIKQGSIESPALFSYLAEQILEDTKAEFSWADRAQVFPGLALEESLFMDDGCVWAPSSAALGRKLEEWSTVLLRAGLALNPSKCKVYFSPYADKSKPVIVQGKPIPSLPSFTIMGVPFRVGASSAELLAPFVQRAKDKFWSLKHLFRARTQLKGRVQLLDRVIGNLVLWCMAALTPDAGGMQVLNSLQLQLVVWCMRVGKRAEALVYSMVGAMVDFRREFLSQQADEQTTLLDQWKTPLIGGNQLGMQTSSSDRKGAVGAQLWPNGGDTEPWAAPRHSTITSPPREIQSGPVYALASTVEEEATSLMQAEPLEGLWHELLEELRIKLEGYGKAERSQVAGHLIRLLAHRAVNSAEGYLLGHMKGRTASLTALLVAMRDDECYGCKVPAGDEKLIWLRQVWDRITKFIPEHPGSRSAEGKWPEHDMPMIIRLFMHPVPTDTPPTSPIPVEDSLEAQCATMGPGPPRKRVRVELSSGSGDRPQTVALDVPLEAGQARLSLSLTMTDTGEENSPASTLPALGGLVNEPACLFDPPLPAPAGLDLGTFGLSEVDFERLQMAWQGGEITVEDVTGEHGPYVTEQLLLQWGPPGSGPTTAVPPVGATVADTVDEPEGDDATGLFTMWWTVLLPRGSGTGVQLREEAFFPVAKRVVRYLRFGGTPEVVLASALMEQVWRRNEEDYTLMMDEFYENMGLTINVDRDRATELTAEGQAVVEWLEAEMWLEYIDVLEGATGESQQVQDARSLPTMSQGECDRWWQWAMECAPRTGRTTRSRSPRRQEDTSSEVSSLMETGRARPQPKRKSDPASGSGRDRRRADDDEGDDGRAGRGREVVRASSSRRRVQRRRHPPRPRRGPMREPAVARSRTPAGHTTTEVRRLLPRTAGRSPPMNLGDATCFWLHTLGLRDGLASNDSRALDPTEHENRMRAVNGIRPEDVVMVMAALLRTLAMFVVEASQLMMARIERGQPQGPDDTVEVEVEDPDEEMWMQTSLESSPKRRRTDNLEQLAADEQEARAQREEEDRLREQQQEDREKEEELQAKIDEALYQQHLAAKYRDWEQWEVLNCPREPPRRLRMTVALSHGEAAEQVSCSVPMARGRPVDLRVQLHEISGQVEGLGESTPSETTGWQMTEADYMRAYHAWLDGKMSDEDLERQVGSEMVAMFQAQKLVESEAGPHQGVPEGVAPMDGEGMRGLEQPPQHDGAMIPDPMVSPRGL